VHCPCRCRHTLKSFRRVPLEFAGAPVLIICGLSTIIRPEVLDSHDAIRPVEIAVALGHLQYAHAGAPQGHDLLAPCRRLRDDLTATRSPSRPSRCSQFRPQLFGGSSLAMTAVIGRTARRWPIRVPDGHDHQRVGCNGRPDTAHDPIDWENVDEHSEEGAEQFGIQGL